MCTIFGQFSSPNLIDTNTSLITSIITADINNDNFKDIIVTRKFSTSIISYYLNQGGLTFGPETIIEPGNNQITKIATGDFNNDGWIDIVSIGDATNSVIVYTNNATTFTANTIDNFAFFDSDIQVADIDNDSDLDIVAIGGTTLNIYYNDGLSNFTSQTITGPIEDFFDITIEDIDGDGFKDIITGGTNISIYKNTNGIISYDTTRTNLIPSNFNLFLELVDLDNDGDFDLFSEADNASGIRWMENDGNGNFSNLQMIDGNPNTRYGASINDFDADGDLDIIIPKDFNFVLYTNDGLGNFDPASTIQLGTPLSITVLHAEDINNDGFIDAIWSADLSFQLNTTTLSVSEPETDALIKLFPNPASNQFSIQIQNPGTLTIHNALGQVVHENIVLIAGRNTFEFNLNPQLYFLTIQSQHKKVLKKLLIE
ncbi:hypothetical protein A9Q87_13350 [Flavobacteriales bacterium 34_180_T64]|nr:hypothetical protein A9Q87_13350 [Flavobacteriales bacterium 34_180_T64]